MYENRQRIFSKTHQKIILPMICKKFEERYKGVKK